jgi:MFS family permease
LIGGSLGDVFGERRVFVAGATAFGVVSTACALAPTLEALIACRALQGAAGALLTPAPVAVIVSAFPPTSEGRRSAPGRHTGASPPSRGRSRVAG